MTLKTHLNWHPARLMLLKFVMFPSLALFWVDRCPPVDRWCSRSVDQWLSSRHWHRSPTIAQNHSLTLRRLHRFPLHPLRVNTVASVLSTGAATRCDRGTRLKRWLKPWLMRPPARRLPCCLSSTQPLCNCHPLRLIHWLSLPASRLVRLTVLPIAVPG